MSNSRVGSKRGRGCWGAPARWLRVGGAQARFAKGATDTAGLRERSASAPQVGMRCECNLGNCACECQTAHKRRGR
eukprot:6188039-Pleurochrysis_carterae.AAC.2